MTINGAESLLQTLIDSGVEVCFANPGTSEMQFVAAIDKIPGMRPILGLFEGVVTGAADGYGRMADKPAATLLHLGSGFSNGMANLHNAKRAYTPIVNLIGDHATYHLHYDSPLTSDVAGHAALTSDWVRTPETPQQIAEYGAEAVAAAKAGRLANLIIPADLSWTEAGYAVSPLPDQSRPMPDTAEIQQVVSALQSGESCCLFLGGQALREEALTLAYQISAQTGAQVISEVFPARIQRGKGRYAPERLPYFGEMAAERLKEFKHLICIGTRPPVSFFAYPDKPGQLWSDGTQVYPLAQATDNLLSTLQSMADTLQTPAIATPASPALPAIPKGPLSGESVGAVVANYLPEGAIISDEAATSGIFSYSYYDGAAQHDWMTLTGGAIGQGLPLAIGAAVACPDQKVISLQADGSAMYTNQSLWTMAREELDICVVIYNNSSYAILNIELMRVGVDNPGEKAKSMLDLSNPKINWVQIAEGMGIKASRVTTTEAFELHFKQAMTERGPRLIEVIL